MFTKCAISNATAQKYDNKDKDQIGYWQWIKEKKWHDLINVSLPRVKGMDPFWFVHSIYDRLHIFVIFYFS